MSASALSASAPSSPSVPPRSESPAKKSNSVLGGMAATAVSLSTGGGLSGSEGGKRNPPGLVINHFVPCCALQTADWLRIFSTISLIVSAALLTFLAFYSKGWFPFEQFIGPIGMSVSLSSSGFLVLTSAALVYLSCKK